MLEPPRERLATLPTPVERWARLGERIGVGELWAKRDDRTGRALGGNKVRGLEWLLAEARARGARRVVVYGPWGSNWNLAATHYARAAGFEVCLRAFHLPVVDWRRPQARAEHAPAAAAAERLAHDARTLPSLLHLLPALLRLRAPATHFFPPGGSSPRASLGHLHALLELARQVEEGVCPRPDRIYVPLGSGGTAAGLLAGAAHLGWPLLVVAVGVVSALVANRWRVLGLARRTLREAGLGPGLAPALLECDGRLRGGGYRIPHPEATELVALARDLAGVKLEATYTGKTLAALRRDARLGHLSGRSVLFWNTFGPLDGLDAG